MVRRLVTFNSTNKSTVLTCASYYEFIVDNLTPFCMDNEERQINVRAELRGLHRKLITS